MDSALSRCHLAQFRSEEPVLATRSSTMFDICCTTRPAYANAAFLWDASSAHHEEYCYLFVAAFF